MSHEVKTVISPLTGTNYTTWKIQCRMALLRDNLWFIVSGNETPPETANTDKYAKFIARRDRASTTIVLAMETSLLYLVGDLEDPVTTWKKLENNFQKKTWAKKLRLRRKLHTMHL